MAARGGTNHGLKKARGALKFVKFTKAHHSGHHKVLDDAIHKATNLEQVLPKEKHVRTILYALSNRTDAAYCIHRLARRLAETYYWTDALKTLLVLHRALRELSTTFCEDLINYSQQEGYIFDVSHLRDDSSPCGECCAWVRKYALYLEERLRCFGVVKHDVVKYGAKSRNPDILDMFEHLPAQQDLLYRLLLCKPVGAASSNRLIQYALSIVARESVKLYITITTGVVNLVDKFFEMHHDDAVKALEIYKKSGNQAEKLSELFEFCRSLDFGRGQKFINSKQPPASFIATMEEYIKEAPTTLKEITDDHGLRNSPKQNSAPVGDLLTEQEIDVKENSDSSLGKNEAVAAAQVTDLLGLDDLLTEAAEFERNSLALAVVPTENSLNAGSDEDLASQIAGWELALFTEPSSNESLVPDAELAHVTEPSSNEAVVEQSKVADRLDRSTLDYLYYNEAMETTEQNGAYQLGPLSSNPFEATYSSCTFGGTAHLTSQGIYYIPPVEMVDMSYQQNFMMLQQQQVMMNRKSTNPFVEPYALPQDTPSDSTESRALSDSSQSNTPSDPTQSITP